MSVLLEILDQHSKRHPEKVALASFGSEVSYGELLHHVARMSVSIQSVDPSGQPVGISLDNGIDWVIADLALLKLGRTAVPLPAFFLPGQIEDALADAGASCVLEPAGLRSLQLPEVVLPPATAKISYTSGSTGKPKGICLSEVQMLATAQSVVTRLGAHRADRHLAVLPLGLLLENVAGLYACLIAGGTYLVEEAASLGLRDPFRPDFQTLATRIAELDATSLILVPELLRGLTHELARGCGPRPNLDLVAVGGARVSDTLIHAARKVGLPVIQGYGLTEAGSVVSIEDPEDPESGTAGRPLGHVRIGLAPDGEVIIHPNDPLGLDGREPIRTGDIGTLDEAGRLTITGRKSNLLITSFGRNISPEWVESELLAQPEIAQAIVHGDGEAAIGAIIVPRNAEIDPTKAVDRANASLPPYARIGAWELSRPFLPSDGTLTTNGRPKRAAIMARRASLPFFERLVMQTAPARFRLQSVAQLQAGLRGAISRETYIAYLAQAYHHVRHTVPLMEEAQARLDARPELVSALDDYIEEERGHEHWILDDIAACGADAEQVVGEGPSSATSEMVEHAYRTIREGNPIAFFGMVFVLEGTSIALAQQGAEAVRTSLQLPESAFRYLTSHGALDQDHMLFFEKLMNSLHDEKDQDAIVCMANRIFDLFGAIFAGIPMEKHHVVA